MERKVYSVYSIKPRAEEGRVFSVLVDGQDSALSTPMCLVINRLAIFQAVGCEFDSRLPLHDPRIVSFIRIASSCDSLRLATGIE